MTKPTILTGLRANNDLHIGNYFGALLPLIDMAKNHAGEYEVNLFVPDLHSFTTPIDHDQLHAQIMHNLRLFASAGLPLDHPNIHMYRQSYVPAHSELTWILNCFTSLGQLNRMTQFKEKAKIQDFDQAIARLHNEAQVGSPDVKRLVKDVETLWAANSQEASASTGLYTYPVLMAADILLYGAAYVPVGDDQTQHLEFARDIAQRMNSKFGELFTVPKPVKEQHAFFGKDQGLRIKDLTDPTKKMSKSDALGKGVIFLGDTPDDAAKKIMSATTDSIGEVRYDPDSQPGISNLLQIHALLSGQPLQAVIDLYTGQQSYGDLKKDVADQVSLFLTAFQKRLAEVDDDALMAKLKLDEEHMNRIANATLLKIQQAVGLRSRAD